MEFGDSSPPSWQPPATLTQRHRRRPSSALLNSSVLIIVLPSLSLLFIVFILLPTIPKIIPHQQKPNIPQTPKHISVKKGWDSINIVLVLFAILCGVFAKRNDNVPTTSDDQSHSQQRRENLQNIDSVLLERSKSQHQNHHHLTSPEVSAPQWFEYSQQRISSPPVTGISQLGRTVSSDPCVRDTGNDRLRCFDDFDTDKFYPLRTPSALAELPAVLPSGNEVEEIPVDDRVLQTRGKSPSRTISPPQNPPQNTPVLPPAPSIIHNKQRRTFQKLPRDEQNNQHHPPRPAPPPVTPTMMRSWDEEKKRSNRKRSNATKEIATAIVSLYSNRKRKRKEKHKQNQEDYLPSPRFQSPFIPPPSMPPAPPLLPPLPSVFHSLFKKANKAKKIHSFSSIPPPPPPPPVPQKRQLLSAGKPPLPMKREERVMKIGIKSPVTVIPTAPPTPPPLKVGEMRYKVRGGYVRVRSAQSSRCGSPEMNGGDEEVTSTSRTVTCRSPDVNVKADTFIARHHNGWRLEKLNSWREKI